MLISIRLAPSALKAMRTAIRKEFPGLKSSAVAESLAYGLGYSSNAALQAAMRDFPDYAIFITRDFIARLRELLGDDDPAVSNLKHSGAVRDALKRILKSEGDNVCRSLENNFDHLQMALAGDRLNAVAGVGGLARGTEYAAWIKVMTAAVNRLLQDKVFSTMPGDNRWEPNAPHGRYHTVIEVAGKPMMVSVAPMGKELFLAISMYSDTQKAGRAASGELEPVEVYVSGTLRRSSSVAFALGREISGQLDAMEEALGYPDERPMGFAPRTERGWQLQYSMEGDVLLEKNVYRNSIMS